jgi:glycosyltransferase involved in cell wall biosynthesis
MQLRVLTFTTLYPSALRPRHGIFVETRLSHFRRSSGARVEVVAPVPWSPGKALSRGSYRLFAQTPRKEIRDGVTVHHPRFFNVPGMGRHTGPFAIAAGAVSTIENLRRNGFEFDVIDAHYFYPDGVAAAFLARRFRIPLVITARGSDVNVLPQYRVARRLIQWAAHEAHAIVTVSAALRDRLTELGVDEDKVCVLRNGVDTDLFHPVEQTAARAVLGLGHEKVLVSVGNLVPEKGHDLAIDAIARIPDASLLVVGDGPQQRSLQTRAERLRVSNRVRFLPARPQAELVTVYSAADALILASSREGWPNVLLESMACGTPVVATDVGGVREIVCDSAAGIVARGREADAIAAALRQLLERPPVRADTRRHAQKYGWGETARAQTDLFARLSRRDRRESFSFAGTHLL